MTPPDNARGSEAAVADPLTPAELRQGLTLILFGNAKPTISIERSVAEDILRALSEGATEATRLTRDLANAVAANQTLVTENARLLVITEAAVSLGTDSGVEFKRKYPLLNAVLDDHDTDEWSDVFLNWQHALVPTTGAPA